MDSVVCFVSTYPLDNDLSAVDSVNQPLKAELICNSIQSRFVFYISASIDSSLIFNGSVSLDSGFKISGVSL